MMTSISCKLIREIHMIPRKFVLLISIAVLLVATLMPGSGATGLPYVDKIAHFGLFFFASWNILHCYSGTRSLSRFLLLIILLAPLTEIAQLYIPLRGFEWLDIVADLLGVLAGYLFYRPRLSALYSVIVK